MDIQTIICLAVRNPGTGILLGTFSPPCIRREKSDIELWNSNQASNSRDLAGNAVKFTVPTVANGRVYISTSSEIDVYGLLPN